MTTLLVILTVVLVIAYIAVLAIYLFIVGNQLSRIADNLDETNEAVRQINSDARLIGPGVEHINRTGGVVAAALPLLYGFAERIVTGVTPRADAPAERVAVPASGSRRSRLLDTVGYRPDDLAAAVPAAEPAGGGGTAVAQLVDAPAEAPAEPGPYGEGSCAPLDDGSQPSGFPVKGNVSSMLYHVPGSGFYEVTVAEVWFATPKHAETAGFSLPPSQR